MPYWLAGGLANLAFVVPLLTINWDCYRTLHLILLRTHPGFGQRHLAHYLLSQYNFKKIDNPNDPSEEVSEEEWEKTSIRTVYRWFSSNRDTIEMNIFEILNEGVLLEIVLGKFIAQVQWEYDFEAKEPLFAKMNNERDNVEAVSAACVFDCLASIFQDPTLSNKFICNP